MKPLHGWAERNPSRVEWMRVDGTEEQASAVGRWCHGMRGVTHRDPVDGTEQWGIQVETPTGLITAVTGCYVLRSGDDMPVWSVLGPDEFDHQYTIETFQESHE